MVGFQTVRTGVILACLLVLEAFVNWNWFQLQVCFTCCAYYICSFYFWSLMSRAVDAGECTAAQARALLHQHCALFCRKFLPSSPMFLVTQAVAGGVMLATGIGAGRFSVDDYFRRKRL